MRLTPEIEMHVEDANISDLEWRTEATLNHGVLNFRALLYVETCLVRLQGAQQREQLTKSEATNMFVRCGVSVLCGPYVETLALAEAVT